MSLGRLARWAWLVAIGLAASLGCFDSRDRPTVPVFSDLVVLSDPEGASISLDGQAVKAYTVFDMSWKTTWKQWQFQANVKNLFDKVYAASGFIERNGHFPGEPRRVYVQAAYRF